MKLKSNNATRALIEIRGIVEARDMPGDGRLPTERELSFGLGVSRRAVRRALEALEAEGLVWRRQGKGTFVGQPPDPTAAMAAGLGALEPAVVMEARLALEPDLAALCAERATYEDLAKLRLLARRTAASEDSDAAELWDGAFHRLIARAAGNRLLLAASGLMDEVRMGADWQAQRHQARSAARIALYDRQHGEIIEAIAQKDKSGAAAAMRRHLQTLAENLVRHMPQAAE